MDWFERLVGFPEMGYEETRDGLEVRGDRLWSRVNGCGYGIGRLELISLGELRRRSPAPGNSRMTVSNVVADVRALHRDPEVKRSLIQVASQFNLLEMIGPEVTPEHGVTRYADDPTQGPACAIAAGAATIYRNYFAPVDGRAGQTSRRQLDGLADLGSDLALAH